MFTLAGETGEHVPCFSKGNSFFHCLTGSVQEVKSRERRFNLSMKHKQTSFDINVISFILMVALILQGCATRILQTDIEKGDLTKQEVESQFKKTSFRLHEISPLQIKVTEVTETRNIVKRYSGKIQHTKKITAARKNIITSSLLEAAAAFLTLGITIPISLYYDTKISKEAVRQCNYDGQEVTINGDAFFGSYQESYTCSISDSKETLPGDSYAVDREDVVADTNELPATDGQVSAIVNNSLLKMLDLDSNGIVTLNIEQFPELKNNKHSTNIKYQYKDASLVTTISSDEVMKSFAALTPAHLRIKPTISLEDDLTDGVLQADEKGSIVVDVMNDGKGQAFGVKLLASGNYPGVSYDGSYEVGDLKPGQTKAVRIPIAASLHLKDGQFTLSFQAKEQLGRDSLPLKLETPIITKALDKPSLALSSLELSDNGGLGKGNGNNIPENNETIELKVKVENRGAGCAKGLKVQFKDIPGALTEKASANLGEIPPGGMKEAIFAVTFPKHYKPGKKDLQITFTAADSRPINVSSSRTWDIPYQYNEPGLRVADLEIFDGDINTNSRGNMNHLIEQDEEIEVKVNLENAGMLQAEAVAVSLTTDHPNIRVTPEEAPLGLLPAGNKKRQAAFQFYVPVSVKPGPIQLNISVRQQDYEPVKLTRKYTVMEASTVGTAAIRGGNALSRISVNAPVPENIDEVPFLPDYRLKNAYAVVMGVGNYKLTDVGKLPYAKADAEAVRNYLVNIGGFPKENIRLMTEGDVSLSEMRLALKDWLRKRVDEDSLVMVYFSGHGVPEKNAPYLLPFDGNPNASKSTAYAVSELKQDINDLPTKRVIIALDACYSGQGRSVVPKGVRGVLFAEDDNTPTDAVMLSASKSDQTSWDYEEKAHGLFTYFMLKGMRGKDVDKDADGFVDVDELFGYLKKEVASLSRRLHEQQIPVMTGSGKGIKLTRSLSN